jgi:hypothetical protein
MAKPIFNAGSLITLKRIAAQPYDMSYTMTTFTDPLYRQGLICKYYLNGTLVWGITDAGRAALAEEGEGDDA